MTTGAGFFLSALIREIGLTEAHCRSSSSALSRCSARLPGAAVFRAQPQQPDLRGAFTLVVAFTVLMSPHHAWYFMWLIPFLCFFASPAVLYLTLSSVALYRVGWPPSVTGAAFLYVPFFILLVLENIKPSNVGEMSDHRLRV